MVIKRRSSNKCIESFASLIVAVMFYKMHKYIATLIILLVLPSIAIASDGTRFIYSIYAWIIYVLLVAAGLAYSKLKSDDKFYIFLYFLISNVACYFIGAFISVNIVRNEGASPVVFLVIFIGVPWLILISKYKKAKQNR